MLMSPRAALLCLTVLLPLQQEQQPRAGGLEAQSTPAIFPHKGWASSPGYRGHDIPPHSGMMVLCKLSIGDSGLGPILALAPRI